MKKVVVITGASSGIGYQTARVFAENGYIVYGLSRTAGDLSSVNYIPTDLTNEDSVIAAFENIKADAGTIDILVNNAGTGISGAIEFTDLNDAIYQFNVNFFGMVRCIKCALGIMRPKGGNIINISSAAAVFPLPFQAFYSASKSAINALTLSLRNEIRGFKNLHVCAIMPGDVKTGFTSARQKCEIGDDIYCGIIAPTIAGMERDEEYGMSPELLGMHIFKIATKRRLKPLYTIGIQYKLLVFLERLLPKRFVSLLMGKMYLKQSKS